ncbi:MAG: prolyl oligopeptidase family serine peptidase [Candidatus Brocadiae bacterium]|nr:prolyl oligopeptidase family serine peptidase [Candidatus Brocadiia bacterium]
MRSLLACLIVAVAAAPLHADIIRLKNGNTIEGKVIAQTDTKVRVKTGDGEVSLPRDRIASIVKRETPLEAYAQQAAELPDDKAQPHFDLAEYCIRHNLRTQAIATLRRGLAIEPANADALATLRRLITPRAQRLIGSAKKLQAEGHYVEAEKPLIDLLDQYPESGLAARAHHLLAVGYAARKQHDKAFTRWRRALKADPGFAEACEGAAQAAIELGRWDDALTFTERALQGKGADADAKPFRERAATLRELAKLETAAKPDAKDPAQLARLGDLLFRLGLPARGLRRIEDAYDAGARSPRILNLLADHYESTGQVGRALDACNELAKANIASDELVRRRARLQPLLLIPKALATRDPRDREALLRQIARSGASFQYIENALREFAVRPECPTGRVEGTLVVDETLARAPFLCYVPKGYTPRRAWPLAIALHRDHDSPKNHFFNWETVANSERYILLFPTAREKGTWKYMDIHVVLSALRHAIKTYNIDTNRVVLSGTGTGGLLAWAVALRHPDRFAGLITRSSPIDDVSQLYLPNALSLPVYQLAGERSNPDILGTGRGAETLLRRYGSDSQREEVPGHRHPALPELNPKVLLWMDTHTRDPYPSRIHLATFEHANATAYWLRVERFASTVFDPDKRITAPRTPVGYEYSPEQLRDIYLSEMKTSLGVVSAAVRPRNRIDITARHVVELTVSLDDRLVDLDKPVHITVNGKLAFSGKVLRSLEYLFETARLHGDPRLACSARVLVHVPRGVGRDPEAH